MKKLIIATLLIATLSISACTKDVVKKASSEEAREVKKGVEEKPIYEKYAEDIHKQMGAEDWCYTYHEVLPKTDDDAYIIDYYSFAPFKSISTWLCITRKNVIDCDMIRITYFD